MLPIGIGLDAVAVTDVHGGRAGEAFGGALQRSYTPVVDLIHVDVEGWLIELHHIDAVGLQRLGFFVEQLGKRERHLHAVAIIFIGDSVDDGHGAGQREFQLARGVGAGDVCLVGMNAALQSKRRHHLRHHRLVAIFADSHFDLMGKIDSLDLFQKAVDEMLAGLLAFSDDIDAGVFLHLERQQRGVAFGSRQLSSLGFPGRPQRIGLGQPFRLWQ